MGLFANGDGDNPCTSIFARGSSGCMLPVSIVLVAVVGGDSDEFFEPLTLVFTSLCKPEPAMQLS